MAVLSANDFSNQMVAQLRILDPSVSAEVGTPERKIIDTVAQSLADNQVDLTGLSNATDIDSKYGANLDTFTALFGFARQGSTTATGYVIFTRNTPAPASINIPLGATVQANVSNSQGQFMQYQTVTGGTLAQNATASTPVLVQCTTAGSVGNAAVSVLTDLLGIPVVQGVTAVSNPAPITGGTDGESDDVYKARFKNTVFRNLAGTEDQYLALALAGTTVTKANVVGPISTYQEYLQVPDVDDAGYLAGVQYANGATLPDGSILGQASTGILAVQGQWTSSLSAIPYAQDIYQQPPPTITNGQTDGTYFYQQGMDYQFNYPALIVGDAEREGAIPGTVAPNFTFLNVFNPSSNSTYAGLQTLSPGDIMLSEFSYLSSASRNSIKHNVYNAVDIYTDGESSTSASTVFLPLLNQFTTNSNDVLYVENFRRDGEPMVRPHPGNFFTPLPQSPLTALPPTITVTNGATVTNYYLGYHYWLVHEISVLGGTIRARDGIEWNSTLNADDSSIGTPTAPSTNNSNPYNPYLLPIPYGLDQTAGSTTVASLIAAQIPVEVDNYSYDSNAMTLQASIEAARPVGNDVLIHEAITRYFKMDCTVIYTPSANTSVSNAAIGTSLGSYFTNQTFGSVIILSDLLGIVQQTNGVANVRWSNDLPSVPNQIRVYETDINGYPLHTPYVDRIYAGVASTTAEIQRLYVPGGNLNPESQISVAITSGTVVSSLSLSAPLTQAVVPGLISLYDSATGLTQTFSTYGANAGSTTLPIEPEVAMFPFTVSSYVIQTSFGINDSFCLQYVDPTYSVNFTSQPIKLSGINFSSIQTALATASAGTKPGSGPYSAISVVADIWQTPDPHHPQITFQLTQSVDEPLCLPSVVNLNVTKSFYTYDSDFYLRDNELAAIPTNMAPNDTVPGAIIRPRAQGTFVRPGIG